MKNYFKAFVMLDVILLLISCGEIVRPYVQPLEGEGIDVASLKIDDEVFMHKKYGDKSFGLYKSDPVCMGGPLAENNISYMG